MSGTSTFPPFPLPPPPPPPPRRAEVRVRDVRRVEALREERLVDVGHVDLPRLRVRDDVPDRVHDLLTPPVGHRQIELVVRVVLRSSLRVRDRLPHVRREELELAEHPDADLVLVHALVV